MFCRLIRLAVALLAAMLLYVPAAGATIVRMQTVLGPIDIELYDTQAPRTVANFLTYVNSGAYNNSFFHRSVRNFVIQSGGYTWDEVARSPKLIPTNAPVANEFSATRSNLRGTIAMAKVGGNPDSATSQWFINLADNAAALDGQNGGFTVFGKVTPGSMAVVDAIAALPILFINFEFSELPMATLPTSQAIEKSNLAIISTMIAVPQNYQGLWWKSTEDGWGMSLTQHGNIVFGAVYTYDVAGLPVWYVLPNCTLTGASCTSDIFSVQGATPPTLPWNGANKVVTKVGTGTLNFTNTSTANFAFTIDNVSSTKAITQQVFGTGTAPAIDFTDLWWNAAEDGWGISLTQQQGILFAAWYTYDAAGKPTWYVVPNCPVTVTGCTGLAYRVTGGSPLTGVWNGANRVVTNVGSVTFAFTSNAQGTMSYTLNGVAGSRAIRRQLY